MVLAKFWTAALLGSALAVASVTTRDESDISISTKIIPGAYIIELADSADADAFLGRLKSERRVKKVSTRLNLDSLVFKGVSFNVESSGATDQETTEMIAALPQVKQVWPVELIRLETPNVTITSLPEMRRRADEWADYAPHVLTQVDKLHAKGYKGQGLRIGVVDTGIDYTHPALGGCFGPGCLVTHGADIVGDAFDGVASPIPDDDPLDQCQGHGTHVAGIVAAQPGFVGPVGAAPEAKLGAYRVFSCGGYSSTDLMIAGFLAAFNDGSDIITGSIGNVSGWSRHPFGVVADRVVEKGVPCTFAIGNRGGGNYGLFAASSPSTADGVMSISSFDIDGTTASSFSSQGPTFEMGFKPQFDAPGRNILSTYPVPLGSYAVSTGTSMSTPLLAGIVALISQVRGTLKPRDLERALTSTAKHAAIATVSGQVITGFAPAIHQGAGIVQAWDAAYVNSHFSVPNLSFNDTEFFVSKTSFKIKNDGDIPTTYILSHTPALSTETFRGSIYRTSSPSLFDAPATLTFEPSTFTLKRGDSAKVRVSVNNARGPFKLTLPYVGAASALSSHTVMASDRMALTRRNDVYSEPIHENFIFQLPVPAQHPTWAVPQVPAKEGVIAEFGDYPLQFVLNVFGSALVRIEVVPIGPPPANTTNIYITPGDNGLGELTIGNVARFPRTYVNPIGWNALWMGSLASGLWAPPGKYSLVVYSLRLYGNRDKKEDYDQFNSGVFEIRYV